MPTSQPDAEPDADATREEAEPEPPLPPSKNQTASVDPSEEQPSVADAEDAAAVAESAVATGPQVADEVETNDEQNSYPAEAIEVSKPDAPADTAPEDNGHKDILERVRHEQQKIAKKHSLQQPPADTTPEDNGHKDILERVRHEQQRIAKKHSLQQPPIESVDKKNDRDVSDKNAAPPDTTSEDNDHKDTLERVRHEQQKIAKKHSLQQPPTDTVTLNPFDARVEATFKALDVDRSGELSLPEMERIFGEETHEFWEDMDGEAGM